MVIPPARPDKPNREFGFVHFSERATVEKLVADAEKGVKPTLDGNTLEVGPPAWHFCHNMLQVAAAPANNTLLCRGDAACGNWNLIVAINSGELVMTARALNLV